VFLAHYDSKSALFPTFFPVLLILLGAGCSLALAALSVTALVSDSRPLDAIASILLGSAGAVAFLVAAINPHGNESPGAMDNASGISVLLALARALPAERSLDATELVFLATGAEEIGLCGALRWIQRHAAELDPSSTVFVNIDSVGVGNGLLFLDVRGHGPDGRAMKDLVREAAARERVAARRVRFLPGVGVDSMPIGSRGFATVTILGKVLGSAARRIHTRRDTLEHLREDALQNAFSFARALARELGTRGGD
jgi:Zn-dependent M28 family amino/carboxypeptidase